MEAVMVRVASSAAVPRIFAFFTEAIARPLRGGFGFHGGVLTRLGDHPALWAPLVLRRVGRVSCIIKADVEANLLLVWRVLTSS
jgi:hypothetical protein